MDVTKFKIAKNGKVTVSFKVLKRTEGDREIWSRVTLVSDETIHYDLQGALVQLRPFVVDLLELPKKEENRIKVTGAEFTMTKKEGIFGAQIYALRSLDHSNIPQEVVTPHKTEVPYNIEGEVEEGLLLDEECVQILKQLQEEAESYVKGHKDQFGLFNGGMRQAEQPKEQEQKNGKSEGS